MSAPESTTRLPLDIEAARRTYLVQCGPCDYGVTSAPCACPSGDIRAVLMDALDELERPRSRDFDRDPAALEWARGMVQRHIDKLRRWQAEAAEQGKAEQSTRWRGMANYMDRSFIGGEGCVIAAFDHRRPLLPPVPRPAQTTTDETRNDDA